MDKAKTLNLVFSVPKKQNIVKKLSAHVHKVPYRYLDIKEYGIHLFTSFQFLVEETLK